MPTALKSIPIKDLKQFTEAVQTLRAASTGPLWYRGCHRADYALLPSLFRHPTETDATQLLRLETDLITRFQERSIPYQSWPINGAWEALFFMQHYGVPTRLLDWTENPFIGLYFGVSSPGASAPAPGAAIPPACVWVLDPKAWNQRILKHITFLGSVLTAKDEAMKGYAPGSDFNLLNAQPVGMYGAYNSRRIVTQRGVFAIFGKELLAMEIVFSNGDFPETGLTKIEIEGATIQAIRSSLFEFGITPSVVYPDLEGLALDLKHEFGFTR